MVEVEFFHPVYLTFVVYNILNVSWPSPGVAVAPGKVYVDWIDGDFEIWISCSVAHGWRRWRSVTAPDEVDFDSAAFEDDAVSVISYIGHNRAKQHGFPTT